jgi:hypothetical protein
MQILTGIVTDAGISWAGVAVEDGKTSKPAGGAQGRREVRALPDGLSSFESYVPTIDSLNEISGWLGTFRERLNQARSEDRARVAAIVERLEARYQHRRAELS